MVLLKVQIMKYLHIVSKSSFSDSSFDFEPHCITSTKKSLKKAKILRLKKSSNVKTFLIHNSRTNIFSDKYFIQNACQEYYKKYFHRKLMINLIKKYKSCLCHFGHFLNFPDKPGFSQKIRLCHFYYFTIPLI